MPNSLTEKQLGDNLYKDEEEEEEKNNEQIKKDLEEVDDVFAANVWSAMKIGSADEVNSKKNNEDVNKSQESQPEEEWLSTSSDEEDKNAGEQNCDNPEFDISQDLSIKQLVQDKEKIMKNMDEEGDPYKQVLVQQLLDMQIKQKKKEVKKNINANPP